MGSLMVLYAYKISFAMILYGLMPLAVITAPITGISSVDKLYFPALRQLCNKVQ